MAKRKTKEANKGKPKISYRYEFYPTEEVIQLFLSTFGCVRWIWNHIMTAHEMAYKHGVTNFWPTPAMFKSHFPWLKEVDSLALTNAQLDLQAAYSSFFKRTAGHPKYKAKHFARKSFKTNNQSGTIWLEEFIFNGVPNESFAYLHLPKNVKIKLRYHKKLPEDAVIKNCTITLEPSGKWYVSILLEMPETSSKTKKEDDISKLNILGMDYKSNGLYMDSEGYCADMPKYFRKSQKKLAKEQKKLSRMREANIDHYEEGPKGGRIPVWKRDLSECKNYQKQKAKVAKLQAHIANQRNDYLNKESKRLAETYDIIGLEGMNMKNIARSCRMGKATCDNGFGMFRNMLEYKLNARNKILVRADQFFPSSQMCNVCGKKNPAVKDRTIREWICPECGAYHDRDVNAAINLKNYAINEVFGNGFNFVEPTNTISPE